MKTLFLLATVAIFSMQEVYAKDTDLEAFERLDWKYGLEKAFEEAKNTQKNVIVMVEDAKCKWCIKIKKGALSDVRVQEILKRYILVKVLRSNKSESSQLKGFDGTIPGLFFMTKDKEILDNIVGYFNVDDFLGYIQEIQANGF